MKVLVLGKEHVKGTSRKTNKPFDNTVVYYQHKKNGVDGVFCGSTWLSATTYPPESVQVGKPYELDRDERGFVIGFELA